MKRVVKVRSNPDLINQKNRFMQALTHTALSLQEKETAWRAYLYSQDKEDEITPDEITDDMTLVMIHKNSLSPLITIKEYGSLAEPFRVVDLSDNHIIYEYYKSTKSAYYSFEGEFYDFYTFTSHIKALEFALEQLKKQQ